MFIAILLLVVGLICILHGVRLLIRRRRNKAIVDVRTYEEEVYSKTPWKRYH